MSSPPDTRTPGGAHRSLVFRFGLPILLLVSLGILPRLGLSPYTSRLFFVTYVWIATGVAWNMLGGFAGQVSFGFAVFYGLGAYTTAFAINGGVNPYLAFLMGGVVASAASLLVGLPTFRLHGPYFAIATIGVSEAVRVVMSNLDVTGGASGYRIVEHLRFNFREHYYTALALAAVALGISMILRGSKLGLGLIAIREDEGAAADVGVNPYASKLLIHALSAAMVGVAGGIFARYSAFIHPDGVFAFQTSVVILLMPIIGGIGTLWGPVLGGAMYGAVHEEMVARFPQLHLLLYGVLLILIILFEPRGIVGLVGRITRRMRRA
jgi:branched-chain amino acid transport system permease protein